MPSRDGHRRSEQRTEHRRGRFCCSEGVAIPARASPSETPCLFRHRMVHERRLPSRVTRACLSEMVGQRGRIDVQRRTQMRERRQHVPGTYRSATTRWLVRWQAHGRMTEWRGCMMQIATGTLTFDCDSVTEHAEHNLDRGWRGGLFGKLHSCTVPANTGTY